MWRFPPNRPSVGLFFAVLALTVIAVTWAKNKDESKANKWLKEANEALQKQASKLDYARWDYESNINKKNEKKMHKEQQEFLELQKKNHEEALKYDWKNLKPLAKRQFDRFAMLGIAALEKDDAIDFFNYTSTMKSIYSTTKVCIEDRCGVALDPDLTTIMGTSKKWNELASVWKKWHNLAGRPIRNIYQKFIPLGNKAAKQNKGHKFKNMVDMWMFSWESKTFKDDVKKLFQEIKPLYEKLHAWVRMKLRKFYKDNNFPPDGTIPAHILGNMWAQNWGMLMSKIDPWPKLTTIDVSRELSKQSYTPEKMAQVAEKFQKGLGLLPMTKEFWDNSIFVKPKDKREMVCHPSAWSFGDPRDFRIKMCARVNMKDFLTIHHEMGHIQYYMQYRNLPSILQGGANPGFMDALGDLMALSVTTPKHLKKIGLFKKDYSPEKMKKIQVKFQLKMALEKLPLIAFAYTLDNWRWGVYDGSIDFGESNKGYWELTLKHMGVSPPIKRSEKDFDPGAKFHIPANVEYIRYFVSQIIQFSFHKALCKVADPDVPLHECDIDGNNEAGSKLATVLQYGLSKPWQEQMKELTGEDNINAKGLLEYFRPLEEFLDKNLNSEKPGWKVMIKKYIGKAKN